MARMHFLNALAARDSAPFALVNDTRSAIITAAIEPALSSDTRRRGLLGREGLSPQTALVIAPSNAIHTFGMKFPIDVLFVARSGEVLKRVTDLRRGRIAAALRAYATIEFCANHPGVAATRVGDFLRLERCSRG